MTPLGLALGIGGTVVGSAGYYAINQTVHRTNKSRCRALSLATLITGIVTWCLFYVTGSALSILLFIVGEIIWGIVIGRRYPARSSGDGGSTSGEHPMV